MGTLLKDYIKDIADSYRIASGTSDLVKGSDLPSKIAELTSKGSEIEYDVDAICTDGGASSVAIYDRFIYVRMITDYMNTVEFTDEDHELMGIFREDNIFEDISTSTADHLQQNLTTFAKDVNCLRSPMTSTIDEEVLKNWLSPYIAEGTKINFIHSENEVVSLIIFTDGDIDFDSMVVPVEPEADQESEDSYTVTIPEGLFKFRCKDSYFKNAEGSVYAYELTLPQM